MLDLDEGERTETQRQRVIRWVWRGFDVLVLLLIAATALSYWADGEERTAFWVAATCIMAALAMAENILTRKALRLSSRWQELHAQRTAELRAARETIATLEGLLQAHGIEEGP